MSSMANNDTSQQFNMSMLEVLTSNRSNPSTESFIILSVANISPGAYVLTGCGLVLMMVALVLNSFVLHAINLNKTMKNKVKFLVRNSICADMVLAIACGTRALPVIVGNLIHDGLVPTMCLETIYSLLIGYSAITQTFASISVAVDRFISVWRPLKYYTSEHSRLVQLSITCFTWFVSMLLTTPSLWIDRAMGITFFPNGHACSVLSSENSFLYAATVIPALLWAGFLVIISMYIIIFALIYILRKKRENLDESNRERKLRKSSISMTITFMMVQVIYIACYLPMILLSINLTLVKDTFPAIEVTVNLLIMDIYIVNSVVDPLIYIIRIRQVRECLLNYLKPSAN